MRRTFAAASAFAWAIDEAWLRTILRISNAEGEGVEAVQTQIGRPLANAYEVTMRGDVAVLPVNGPIFRRANMFTEVSGATSIDLLARDFASAVASPDVRAIVLEIDSPGGEVTGVNAFADQIFAARGKKPIVAYVDGCGASAAYWIASAADEIVLDATARVGSIGVVQSVPNPNAATADEIEIVSSQSPNKRPDVTTDEGRAVIRANVDALADVFIGAVARNRGVTPEKVASDFGKGGMAVGAAAVSAGLADRLGSMEGVIASLNARPFGQTTAATAASKRTSMLDKNAPKANDPAGTPAPAPAPAPAAPPAPEPPPADDGDTVACPACGAMNDPDAKFCDQCGAEMKPGSQGASSAKAICALAGTTTLVDAVPLVAGAFARASQFDGQAKELEASRAAKRSAEIDAILEGGLRGGKRAIARDRKSLLVAAGATEQTDAKGNKFLAGADPERLKLIVAALPIEVANIGGNGTETPATGGELAPLTASEKRRCKRMGWSEEAYAREKAKTTNAGVPAKES
jgi:ClpP class serine protease